MTKKKPSAARKRKPLSKEKRSKRARTAASARWKDKWQLEPGQPSPWSKRSLANREKIIAAAIKGGQTTSARLRRQQDLFWRWYHGDCKEGLEGPLKTVVETYEELSAFHEADRRAKDFQWEAFTHYVLSQFVVTPCWTKRPEAIERQMRSQCQRFIMAKLGDDILNPYVAYEAAKDEQRQLKAMFRLLSKSKPKTKRRR